MTTPTPSQTPEQGRTGETPGPSLREQITALVPSHAHAQLGLTSARWTWSTPDGVWTVVDDTQLFVGRFITITGPDTQVTRPASVGIDAIRQMLVAVGAVSGE